MQDRNNRRTDIPGRIGTGYHTGQDRTDHRSRYGVWYYFSTFVCWRSDPIRSDPVRSEPVLFYFSARSRSGKQQIGPMCVDSRLCFTLFLFKPHQRLYRTGITAGPIYRTAIFRIETGRPPVPLWCVLFFRDFPGHGPVPVRWGKNRSGVGQRILWFFSSSFPLRKCGQQKPTWHFQNESGQLFKKIIFFER